MYLLSVVLSVRDRDRMLARTLKTLENQILSKKKFEVIVVDYGGRGTLSAGNLLKIYKLNIRYYYVKSRYEYNESHSKNIGIKRAKGRIVLCTNADILFAYDLLKKFVKYYSSAKKCLYQLQRRNLPKNADIDKVVKDIGSYGNTSQQGRLARKEYQGDFQATTRENWNKLRSYDERMVGWGYMDQDLALRMERMGVKQVWLNPDNFRIYHQYHESFLRAKSKNRINYHLSRTNRSFGYLVNKKGWGDLQKQAQVLMVFGTSGSVRTKRFLRRVRPMLAREDVVVNSSKKKLGQEDGIFNHKISLDKNFDYLIEVEHPEVESISHIIKGLNILRAGQKECVYLVNRNLPRPLLVLIKRLFKLNGYPNIRLYTSKMSSLITTFFTGKRLLNNYLYEYREFVSSGNIKYLSIVSYNFPKKYLTSHLSTSVAILKIFISDYYKRITNEK